MMEWILYAAIGITIIRLYMLLPDAIKDIIGAMFRLAAFVLLVVMCIKFVKFVWYL